MLISNYQYIVALFFYSPVTYIFPEKDYHLSITLGNKIFYSVGFISSSLVVSIKLLTSFIPFVSAFS